MSHIYNYLRSDNILYMICIYITLIGSLVIIIKKYVSKRIVLRIPKSNILPQPNNDKEETIQLSTLHSTPRIIQVGLITKNNTGDLLSLCQYSIFHLNKKRGRQIFFLVRKRFTSAKKNLESHICV